MGGKRCIGRVVEGHEKGGGGGNKGGECKAGRRRNFFLSFIYSVSPLRVGDPRGGSQFLCVCGPVLYSISCT